MTDGTETGFIFGGGAFLIGCVTWFFSTRRRAFIRTFVPRGQLRQSCRSLARGDEFRRGMRTIAVLQMAAGIVAALIALAAWRGVGVRDGAELLLTRRWWHYAANAHWYDGPYHWLNLLEGCAWLMIAALVLRRHIQHRGPRPRHLHRIELFYAAAFVTFAISDFREAYAVHSWLILFKAANLIVLLRLRRFVLQRCYPRARVW